MIMITVKENTTLVGVSELRGGIEKILAKAKHGPVILEKRHRATAVLMSSGQYQRMLEVYELAEDLVLGQIAKARHAAGRERDYVAIEKLLK
jgi:PHD/YefM family antitoxin component YafN of YafNO toxin-antitoxin module